MADAKDVRVWTEHAEKDHAGHHLYTESPQVEQMLKKAKVRKGSLIVDAGCGSGLWRPVFKDYKYVGVDQNEKMIEIAKGRNFDDIKKETKFVVGQLRQMDKIRGFGKLKGKIDVIWTSAVIQHNLHEEKSEVLNQFYNMLKPHGFYLCTEVTFTPTNSSHVFKNYSEDMTDGYSFTESGWEKYFAEHGFVIVDKPRFDYYLLQKDA